MGSVGSSRWLLGVALLCAASARSLPAQMPDVRPVVDSAMAPLAWLVGEWRGEGSTQMATGRHTAAVLERVEARLDGRVFVIEGVGRDGDRVVHHAFAVLTWDPDASRYSMRAFREGRLIEADTRLSDGVFTWSFAVPGGRVRYHIRNDAGAWVETGEYSSDGTNWRQFFDMRLERVAAGR